MTSLHLLTGAQKKKAQAFIERYGHMLTNIDCAFKAKEIFSLSFYYNELYFNVTYVYFLKEDDFFLADPWTQKDNSAKIDVFKMPGFGDRLSVETKNYKDLPPAESNETAFMITLFNLTDDMVSHFNVLSQSVKERDLKNNMLLPLVVAESHKIQPLIRASSSLYTIDINQLSVEQVEAIEKILENKG